MLERYTWELKTQFTKR